MALEITVQRSTQRKARPPEQELGFGKFFTDHMFRVDYDPDQGGWHAARTQRIASGFYTSQALELVGE